MALMNFVGTFRRNKMKGRVVMILHDAIWVEAPVEEAEVARPPLEQSMKNAVDITFVRLEVDFQ